MQANWDRVIRANMEPLAAVAGQPATVFRARGEKTVVLVVTDFGEFPTPIPPLDRMECSPMGGHELSFDVSDPDFLILQKVVGVTEYMHYIPWSRIVDIVFRYLN